MQSKPNSEDICFLLGAGASQHANVPTMLTLWDQFFDSWSLTDFADAIDILRNRQDKNIELLLKHLHESTIESVNSGVLSFPGNSTSAAIRSRANKIIEFEIRKYILHQVDHHTYKKEYDALVGWLPQNGPLDVFTLNYDLVIEDFGSRNRITIIDGFDRKGAWRPELWPLAKDGIRIWKLHGSVNWRVNRKTREIKRGYPPRSLAGVMRSDHSASATGDVELIWPAVYKEFEGPLSIMIDAFAEKLLHCKVLVIAGYRCNDPRILNAIVNGHKLNRNLHTFVLCGGSGEQVANSIRSQIPSGLSDRIQSVGHMGGKFPQALNCLKFLNQVNSVIRGDNLGGRHLLAATPKISLVCLGKYTAICTVGEKIYLAQHEPKASVFVFDVKSKSIEMLRSWHGWPRDLEVTEAGELVVVDCKMSSQFPVLNRAFKIFGKQGIGCLRILKQRKPYLNVAGFHWLPLLRLIPSVIYAFWSRSFYSFRQFDFISSGVLSWPTSVIVGEGGKEYIVAESRNLTIFDCQLNSYRRVTTQRFLNLIDAKSWSGGSVILLEAVLDNMGSLWKYDLDTEELDLLASGIESPGGIAVFPKEECVLISINREKGKLLKLNISDQSLEDIQVNLRYPTKLARFGNQSLLILTREAVMRFDLKTIL